MTPLTRIARVSSANSEMKLHAAAIVTSTLLERSVPSVAVATTLKLPLVTEAGTVFLLGLLTQPEADAAINVARTTAGVKRVVNLFEIITPAKARELDKVQSTSAYSQPAEVKNP